MSRSLKFLAAAVVIAVLGVVAVQQSAATPKHAHEHNHAQHGAGIMSPNGHACLDMGDAAADGPCMMRIHELPNMYAANYDRTANMGYAIGAAAFPPVCTGTGTDGYRFNVYYAYDPTTGNKLSEVEDNIRDAVAEADRQLYLKSVQPGATTTRRFRFGTEAAAGGCRVKITAFPIGHDYFLNWNNGTIFLDALRDNGLIQQDVTAGEANMVFLDDRHTGGHGCGLAGTYQDTSVTNNRNADAEQRYLLLAANCWSPNAALHEMIHTLGAVQLNSTNNTGAMHCNDGADVMCYNDGGVNGEQRAVCAPTAYRTYVVDCNSDDYFSVNPPAGSYLATNWNTANSPFLISTPRVTAKAPTIRLSTAPRVASALPYVATPVTVSVTAASLVGYLGDGSAYGYNDCFFRATTPVNPTAAATIAGVVGCRTPGVNGVKVAVADRLGRDAGIHIPFSATAPTVPVSAQVTTSTLRNTDGTITVTAVVKGRLPGATTFSTPLVGINLWAMDVTGNRPLLASGDTQSDRYTDHTGTARWILNASYGGHTAAIYNSGTAPWTIAEAQVTLPTAFTPQTLTFSAPVTVTLRSGAFPVAASATSGLPVTLLSLTPMYCTVTGTTVTPRRTGSCMLQASQRGNTVYGAATSQTRSIRILP
jgi:hypothetical protein